MPLTNQRLLAEFAALPESLDQDQANSTSKLGRCCHAAKVPFILVMDQDNRLCVHPKDHELFQERNKLLVTFPSHLTVLGASAARLGVCIARW